MTDFHVTVTIRNGRLWREIRDRGFTSLTAFTRHHNLQYGNTASYLALKLAPYREDGTLRASAIALCDALGMAVEDLFPPAFLERALLKNSISVEMSQGQIERLMSPPADPERIMLHGEAGERVRGLLEHLPPSEADIITRRFGFGGAAAQTLDEVASAHNITKERIRQVEMRALRRLRAWQANPQRDETYKVADLADDEVMVDA